MLVSAGSGSGKSYRIAEILIDPKFNQIKSIDIDRAIDHLIKYNLNEVISVDHNLVQNGAIRAMKYETVFLKTLSVYLGVIKTKIADIHTLSELKKTEKRAEK